MDKYSVRRHVSACKKMLDDSERNAAAERVFDTVAGMAAFILADRVLMYNSLPDELSTRRFIEAWAGRKKFYLPRVNGIDLEILPYDRTRMHLGAFRIEEPDGNDTVDINDIDLVIVPAVAYSRSCARVGRGKGYYDRLLSRARRNLTTIGVCYDFQLFDDFDTEEHDIPVDFVVADHNGIIRRK